MREKEKDEELKKRGNDTTHGGTTLACIFFTFAYGFSLLFFFPLTGLSLSFGFFCGCFTLQSCAE